MDTSLTGLLVICICLLTVSHANLNCIQSICQCQTVSPNHINVHCVSKSLQQIPTNLPSNVTLLDVSFNEIQAIDGTNLGVFHYLKTLNLRNNRITSIDSWAFQKLTVLEELDLENNLLEEVGQYMFSPASHLKLLFLGNNHLRRIGPYAFAHLSLERLDLKGNKQLIDLDLRTFAESQVQDLVLDLCSVSSLTNGTLAPIASTLKVLSLSNMAQGLNLDSFSLPGLNLDMLQLVQNKLTTADLGFLSQIKVKQLDISQNDFVHFNMSHLFGLQNVEALTIKKSKIESFILNDNKPDVFKKSVLQIDICENNLTSFPVDLIQWFPNLSSLNVAKNPITNLYRNVTTYLDRLQVVDISNISMTCNCDLDWFRKWKNSTRTNIRGELCTHKEVDTKCHVPRDISSWIQPDRIGPVGYFKIFCKAEGYPLPNITIYHMTREASYADSSAFSVSGQVYIRHTIIQCSEYVCIAENKMGYINHTFFACPAVHHAAQSLNVQTQHTLRPWTVTVLLAVSLIIAIIIFAIIYQKHKNKLNKMKGRGGSDCSGGHILNCTHVPLSRLHSEEDVIWGSTDLN